MRYDPKCSYPCFFKSDPTKPQYICTTHLSRKDFFFILLHNITSRTAGSDMKRCVFFSHVQFIFDTIENLRRRIFVDRMCGHVYFYLLSRSIMVYSLLCGEWSTNEVGSYTQLDASYYFIKYI